MPSRDVVMEFVRRVESGDHVGAIERYYAPDATMQENGHPPRAGREALVANERRALSRLREMITHPARRVVVDGDHVVIHWVFEMIDHEGRTRRLEELALQEWRGDLIARERFFYDPAQLDWEPATP